MLFDIAKFMRLKKAYEKAVKEGAETFIFDDQEVLTTFAKYLIEYLEQELWNEKR